jgi:hypothetical protein
MIGLKSIFASVIGGYSLCIAVALQTNGLADVIAAGTGCHSPAWFR